MPKRDNLASSFRGPRVLDQRDAREFSKAAKEETRKITHSEATARSYLVREGFITRKTGKLTERYGGRDKS